MASDRSRARLISFDGAVFVPFNDLDGARSIRTFKTPITGVTCITYTSIRVWLLLLLFSVVVELVLESRIAVAADVCARIARLRIIVNGQKAWIIYYTLGGRWALFIANLNIFRPLLIHTPSHLTYLRAMWNDDINNKNGVRIPTRNVTTSSRAP